jgi:NADPH:quinone reductase
MARAIGITRPGGPEVLEVVDRPVREPGEGEVRLSVAAAAVNTSAAATWIRPGRPGWTPRVRSSRSARASTG